MYRKTLRINLFGIEPPVEEALRRAAPLDRFEHAVEAFPALEAEAFCSCDIAVVDLRLFADAPGGARPSRCLADLMARRRMRLDTFYSAVAVVADAAEAACWTPEDYGAFDALWTRPLDATRAAFELARLQRSAKRDADLSLAQQYLDTAIDSIPELVWFKDARGAHLKVNDAFCETVGKTKDQVEGRGHYYIWDITPDEYAQGEFVCLESEEETMRSSTTLLFDEQVKTKSGMRQFKTYKSPLIDYDGTVMGTVGVAHDVTDLGNIRTELEIFIDSMPYAVVVLDNEGAIVNINERAEDYFDVKRERVVGGDFDRWRRIVLGDAVVDANDFEDSSFFTASIRGEPKTFEVNERAILDVFGNATGVLRIYRDVTNERKLEQRVIAAARTDYLTGLYNRRYFYEHVEEHRGSQPVTLHHVRPGRFQGHQRPLRPCSRRRGARHDGEDAARGVSRRVRGALGRRRVRGGAHGRAVDRADGGDRARAARGPGARVRGRRERLGGHGERRHSRHRRPRAAHRRPHQEERRGALPRQTRRRLAALGRAEPRLRAGVRPRPRPDAAGPAGPRHPARYDFSTLKSPLARFTCTAVEPSPCT